MGWLTGKKVKRTLQVFLILYILIAAICMINSICFLYFLSHVKKQLNGGMTKKNWTLSVKVKASSGGYEK